MAKRSIVRGVLTMLAVAACAGGSSPMRECRPSVGNASALIVVANRTIEPICVYVNGRFVCVCPPFGKQKIRSHVLGKVQMFGRMRCDTWGPETFTLAPGKTMTWRLGVSNRRVRSGRVCSIAPTG